MDYPTPKTLETNTRLKDTRTIRRGIIRHLFVVLDLSLSMEEKDLVPSRVELAVDQLQGFILEYFDQNPISQLGIIVTRDGLAEKLTELSGLRSPYYLFAFVFI